MFSIVQLCPQLQVIPAAAAERHSHTSKRRPAHGLVEMCVNHWLLTQPYFETQLVTGANDTIVSRRPAGQFSETVHDIIKQTFVI